MTLDLAPSPASVREARRFTIETLEGWGRADLAATGALLVTELVTNAVLHAKTVLQVCLLRSEDTVRLEVSDGSLVRPAVRDNGVDATTGRGLALVSRLSASWGVDMSPQGKTVWLYLAPDAEEQQDLLFVVPDLDLPDPGEGPPVAGPSPREQAHSRRVAALRLCA